MAGFNPEKFVGEAVEAVREQVGDATAVIGASGGVDSTVAAAIGAKALGQKLTAVFVDTGLLRKGEPEQAEAMLSTLGLHLVHAKAATEFFEALKGVTEPEAKRRIIGERFVRVFEREAEKSHAKYLMQGTIAPDWIESGGGPRDTIKSHHNVGGLPADLKLGIVEPLRDLYKDEVRKVARHLGLAVAERQPFPGPGLAVRCLGECTPHRVEIVREACAIVEEEVDKAVAAGKMEAPWQYFAALLPVRSVGVHGDLRAYGETVVVRAVHSIDGMSAAYSKVPHETLDRISVRITNALKKDVNRVVYDISNKPPATVEWE
jgi:GMP synthase (glutamine-hydrolysing)